MMRLRVFTCSGILVGLLGLMLPAQAATEFVDQQQLDSNGMAFVGVEGVVAQTFTAGMSGVLSRVSLNLSAGDDTDLALEIRAVDASGAPTGDKGPATGTVLAAQTFPGDLPTVYGTWVDVEFTTPTTVTAGTTYAIVLRKTAWRSTNPTYLNWSGTNSDVYSGGRAWRCGPNLLGEDGCWDDYVSFSTWDLMFKTYVTVADAATEQVNAVADAIRAMGLDHGTADSLISKLDEALQAWHADDLEEACGALGALLNQVRALEGKKLTSAQAAAVNADIAALRAEMGCT